MRGGGLWLSRVAWWGFRCDVLKMSRESLEELGVLLRTGGMTTNLSKSQKHGKFTTLRSRGTTSQAAGSSSFSTSIDWLVK